MKKKTLVVIHCMPTEIEMFERFMIQYRKALSYLDENDDVTLKVTLNLNPELTDWDSSELKQDYFVNKFATLFNGIRNIKRRITRNNGKISYFIPKGKSGLTIEINLTI